MKTHWALALVKGIIHSTLTYTSELILCFTTCVHSATRHNIYTLFKMYMKTQMSNMYSIMYKLKLNIKNIS